MKRQLYQNLRENVPFSFQFDVNVWSIFFDGIGIARSLLDLSESEFEWKQFSHSEPFKCKLL